MDSQFLLVIYPFVACVPRLAAVFLMLPFFTKRTTQGMVRAEFIVIMAIFVYPSAIPDAGITDATLFSLLAIAGKEALVGVILGFFLGTLFWVAENVGYLIDLQTGTQNALIFDPVNEHQEGPTSGFMLHLVIALVLAGGGLLVILDIIFQSFQVWPVLEGLPRLGDSMGASVSARADTLFSTTVRFVAPVIILLLLVEISLGLLNRMADSLDVYTLAMPIKSTVAFFVLLVYLSFIYESVMGFLRDDNAALRVIRELAQ